MPGSNFIFGFRSFCGTTYTTIFWLRVIPFLRNTMCLKTFFQQLLWGIRRGHSTVKAFLTLFKLVDWTARFAYRKVCLNSVPSVEFLVTVMANMQLFWYLRQLITDAFFVVVGIHESITTSLSGSSVTSESEGILTLPTSVRTTNFPRRVWDFFFTGGALFSHV